MRKGFSLIEVLVFISILSLFFLAAMTVGTYSLRDMKNNEYKIIASHLGEEAVEWLKNEKETDWENLLSKDNGSGTTYCLVNLDFNNLGECQDYNLGTPAIFKRELFLQNNQSQILNVTVTVSWQKVGGGEQNVVLNSSFNKLE